MHVLLNTLPDISVVGEALTGEEALRLIVMLMPGLVLMKINMPGTNGIAATARILAYHPTPIS
jgi:DNA-binding NarL/FixJ family response regulator